MATTITVVHTYFYPGHIYDKVELDIPPTPVVIPEALLRQPLGPWDFPLSPLPNTEMETKSPGLPSIEPQLQPAILVIELNSTATPKVVATSPPYLEYHLEVTPMSEEDPSEEQSSAMSYALHGAEFDRHFHCIEVLSRNPCIICTPFVPRGRRARGSRHYRLRLP